MCTLIVLHRCHPDVPTLVAANRDELHTRAATVPRRLAGDAPIYGGLDVVGGGTWMGVHAGGLFVGLTNQRGEGVAAPGPRSRGQVTLDALRAGSVEGVRRHLRALDARAYASFNLLYGDAERLEVAYARRDARRVEIVPLGPGLHVLANDRMGSPHFPKVARAAALVAPLAERPWPALLGPLRRALGDHVLPHPASVPRPPPGSAFDHAFLVRLQALCIHTPAYGTRSATILALEPGRVVRYLFADGSPCETPFEDVSALIAPAAP